MGTTKVELFFYSLPYLEVLRNILHSQRERGLILLRLMQGHRIATSDAPGARQRSGAGIGLFVHKVVIISQVVMVGTFQSVYFSYRFHRCINVFIVFH